MNFIERLQYFMKETGINDNQITMDAGLSIGLIGKAKKSGKAMNSINIEKILLAYPDLNPNWLLTGRGKMTISPENGSIPIVRHTSETYREEDIITRPRIPYDAAAGALSTAVNGISQTQCERLPLIPTFPNYDFTIITRGDSMLPDFVSGDELACSFVSEKSFIQWGRVHVLDTAQGIVVKRIFNQCNSILCKSINQDYPDFEIPKEEIYNIALVIGLVRHF